jgi:hypothetical protein
MGKGTRGRERVDMSACTQRKMKGEDKGVLVEKGHQTPAPSSKLWILTQIPSRLKTTQNWQIKPIKPAFFLIKLWNQMRRSALPACSPFSQVPDPLAKQDDNGTRNPHVLRLLKGLFLHLCSDPRAWVLFPTREVLRWMKGLRMLQIESHQVGLLFFFFFSPSQGLF